MSKRKQVTREEAVGMTGPDCGQRRRALQAYGLQDGVYPREAEGRSLTHKTNPRSRSAVRADMLPVLIGRESATPEIPQRVRAGSNALPEPAAAGRICAADLIHVLKEHGGMLV